MWYIIINFFLKPLILSWFINEFEPLQKLLERLISSLNKTRLRKVFIIPFILLLQILECYKCCAFWITLILTGNPFIASFNALIAKLYSKRIKPSENWQKI